MRLERAVVVVAACGALFVGCGGGGGGGGGGGNQTADGWTVERAATGNFANGDINAAAAPNGALHVSAYQFNEGLYHATNASGAWAGALRAEELSGTTTGTLNDVTVDPSGKVHLVTTSDGTPTSPDPALLYITDRSGAFTTSTLFAGSTASTSIRADASGALHVAFDDFSASRLRYVSRSAGGAWGSIVELGSEWINSNADLALDAAGRPAIAYEHAGYGTLELFRFTSSWQFSILDGTRDPRSDTGWSPALAIDGGGGLHVLYWDYGTQQVKYTDGGAPAVLAACPDWARPAVALDGQGRLHAVWVNGAGKLVWATKATGWTVTETSISANAAHVAAVVTGTTLHVFYADEPGGNLAHASRSL